MHESSIDKRMQKLYGFIDSWGERKRERMRVVNPEEDRDRKQGNK